MLTHFGREFLQGTLRRYKHGWASRDGIFCAYPVNGADGHLLPLPLSMQGPECGVWSVCGGCGVRRFFSGGRGFAAKPISVRLFALYGSSEILRRGYCFLLAACHYRRTAAAERRRKEEDTFTADMPEGAGSVIHMGAAGVIRCDIQSPNL